MTFQGFYSIMAKFKDFQGLENEAIFFQGFSRMWEPCTDWGIFFVSTSATNNACFTRANRGPRWQSGNTLASHLCGRGSIPVMAVSGKAGSCLPLVGSLQYRTLANYIYWFPLPFQLPVVIWPVQCWKRRKTPNKQTNTRANIVKIFELMKLCNL